MRRRLPVLLFAALVVLTTVPASAAEPDPSLNPVPERTAPPTPDPAATPAPTPEPTPDAPDGAATPDPGQTGDATPAPSATDAPAAASPAADTKALGGIDVAGEYIVVLRPGSDTAAVAGRHQIRDGIRVGRRFTKVTRAFTAHLDRAQRALLAKDPSVAEIVPDEIIHITAQTVPTGVSRVGARGSSVAAIDGSDQRVDADVAIVDTGIGPHPDLNIAGGYNCTTSNRANWKDFEGHGTHVAGTVGALDNDFGVVGVAPGVRLWAVRILNADGYGKLSWYVCGLDWILAQRDPNDSSRPLFEAANMSVAKYGTDDHACGNVNQDILHQAICRVVAGGITVVAAAGNDHGSAARRVPAAYDEVITVSALADTDGKAGGTGGNRCYSWGTYDKDDTFADFSNYGSDVDIIAPGKCIWSTKPGPTYGYSSGTSMAAPAVTGAVALYKSSRPNATPKEVKEALQYLGNLNWRTSTDPDKTHEKLLDVSRLGPLGTFSMDTGTAPMLGERGGKTTVPVTLSRSSTFFERVALRITSVPAGWSAALVKSSLLGWTAKSTTLEVRAPDPVAAGTYEIGLRASNQGRVETATATVVVENDKPSARPPSGTVAASTLTNNVPIKFTWGAATDPSSSIGGYEVAVRTDGGDWSASVSRTAASRSLSTSVAPGHRVEARLRARDRVGNWSDWVTSSPVAVSAVDDRSTSVKVSASWAKVSSSGAYRHTLRRTGSVGAWARLTFTGRSVAVVAPVGAGRGKIAVYIDGVYKRTVSLRSSTGRSGRIVYVASFSSSGTHHIQLRKTGSGNVYIDAFIVAS